MSDLSDAAAALGVPEPIVERSAAARAVATGSSVDEVLAAWAGGGTVASEAPAPTEEPAAPAEETAPEPETPAEETAVEAPAETPADTPKPMTPAAAAAQPAAVTRSPIPAEVTAAEAANLPEVITVPTAGIRERTNFAVPRWLAAVMLIIPAFALFALGGSATGECGAATELNTDIISGEVINCDGSEFTGSGVGGGGADFIAMGEELYNGAPSCDGCHGVSGGGGVGPPLTGVTATFGACPDHIEWVSLGTQGFQAEGRDTYGDSGKAVGGGGRMPGFNASLSEEQIAAVAAFERVRFGGADPTETLADCGLAEEEGGGGEEGEVAPEEGEEPTDEQAPGEDVTTTTLSGAEAGIGRTP